MRRSRRRTGSFPLGRRRVLGCEPLERRWLLSITVDTLVDERDGSILDGDVSLRDALAAAVAGETIDFEASLDGGTILLSLGELAITKALSIDASALAASLTINASGGSRIFNIDDGTNQSDSPVTIRGVTLIGGNAADGGAICTGESHQLWLCWW